MTKDEMISKRMAFILRWRPDTIGVKLDKEGYVDVDKFISGYNKINKTNITIEDLKRVVANDDKTRYSFDATGDMIRANQGHSKDLNIEITMSEITPPDILYHGTASDKILLIKAGGLKPMSRKYVHLTDNLETAKNVGSRYAKSLYSYVAILHIDTKKMIEDGYKFKLSENNVWQVEAVPAKYFKITKA